MEGLVAALNKQVAVLPLEMKQSFYRIAQEALHNIVKHARASIVVLKLIRQGNDILLEVRDNGRGFDPTASFPGHLGLRSMQERAAKVDTTLTIDSAPGQGTCISLRAPLVVESQ